MNTDNTMELREMWNRAKAIYISSIFNAEEKSQTEIYLNMVTSVHLEDNVFAICTSSKFIADILSEKYSEKLKSSLTLAGADPNWKIRFRYDEGYKPSNNLQNKTEKEDSTDPGKKKKDKDAKHQSAANFISTQPLNENFTFEEFVEGPSNGWALAAAKGVVENPGAVGYNPLFIHGGTGLGKTHLMQAIGNEILKRNKNAAVCYLTAETFLNEYVNSIQNQKINEFRNKYRNIDVLLLDDIQFLQRGRQCQEEFFFTFNTLIGAKKQIVLTSDVAPKNLEVLEERLISRFEGGMVQEIESPTYETRLAILRKKAESLNTHIPDIAIKFIAEKIKSHVRAMEGALGKVKVSLSFSNESMITYDFLARLLKDFIEKEQAIRKITIEDIQSCVIEKYSITKEQLLSSERTQIFVLPRQMAMYIARKCTTRSLQEIAKSFEKTHATVLHGIKTIEGRIKTDPKVKDELEDVLSKLGLSMLE